MSHHRITTCQHCGKETEDTEQANSRWERDCDACGKRVPESYRDGTMSQISLTRNDGTRVCIDACGDCIGNGNAMKKLTALITAIKEQR